MIQKRNKSGTAGLAIDVARKLGARVFAYGIMPGFVATAALVVIAIALGIGNPTTINQTITAVTVIVSGYYGVVCEQALVVIHHAAVRIEDGHHEMVGEMFVAGDA